MRITLKHAAVKAAKTAFTKVIPRNGSLPILHYLCIRQGAGIDATITATNLEETLQYHVPDAVQDTDGPKSFLIAFDALKKLRLKKGDTVTLESGADSELPTVKVAASISGQTIHSSIATMSVSDFPTTLREIPVESYAVGLFLNAYRKAITFASTDCTRHVLNGVFRHTEEHALVATDGRRLGMFTIPDLPVDSDFILPPSKLLANGVFSAETGAIGIIEEDDRQIVEFLSGPWRYQCKCVEGMYPNYQQVIPGPTSNFAGSITFAEGDIPLVETAVSQFAQTSDNQIYVYGDEDRGVVIASQPGEDGSRAHVVLPNSTCESSQGEPLVQSINGCGLLDGLKAGCNICHIPSDVSPWRGAGTDCLHVVMPLRMADQEKDAVIEFVNQHAISPQEGADTMSTEEATEATGDEEHQTNTENTPQHKPDLTLVTTDPVQELVDAVTAAQEAVKEANSVLHGIKGKLRAVEKHYRARDRQFAKSEKVLAQLQEVVNF
jgi:DNA polymerase III sliding clamp (beta) subunit (PCNA family)